MDIKQRKTIINLSFKTLQASRKRNVIVIIAIVLTTLLFTSLFTILMSINSSYQTYQFKQAGGYEHGTFENLTQDQKSKISKHPNVKEVGERVIIGIASEVPFDKEIAEISYMDANCTKWSYAEPTVGNMPTKSNEILMDTRTLELLGVEPKIGARVKFSYQMTDKEKTGPYITDTFLLSGYYKYNDLMPTHYINVSKDYMKKMERKGMEELGWDAFKTDLNVMMKSSTNIRALMEEVERDLGYDWNTDHELNSVGIGVNWGYTSTKIVANMDFATMMTFVVVLVLIMLTGYLIIYNIFQISVARDIRFYGLLKIIGFTPRQLKKIIRNQAICLCVIGIPIGLLFGYLVGGWMTPMVIESTTFGDQNTTMSTSPAIFIGSTIFSFFTVLLSCEKPGKKAGKVSPIEATGFVEVDDFNKKERAFRGAKIHQIALANVGRNKSKTAVVLVSLSLAVVLMNTLVFFVRGLDKDEYLNKMICADFIVSGSSYFKSEKNKEKISSEEIEFIKSNTKQSVSGCGYETLGMTTVWQDEERWMNTEGINYSAEECKQILQNMNRRNGEVRVWGQVEGFDKELLDKFEVYNGDVSAILDEEKHNIAIAVYTDDYDQIINEELYPSVGDTIKVSYVERIDYIDNRTGELSNENTPVEYVEEKLINSSDVEYKVCAWVKVPQAISYRYTISMYGLVLPVSVLERDSNLNVRPLFYMFDTPNKEAENEAETFLSKYVNGNNSNLMYESKATQQEEFEQFRKMFVFMGGLLCCVIGIIGLLNFLNVIITEILSRRKELAVIQAVGMTEKQLKRMLVYEAMFYVVGLTIIAFFVSLILQYLVGNILENMFWFFKAHFTIISVILSIPVFTLLGWFIPTFVYSHFNKQSMVERLREFE